MKSILRKSTTPYGIIIASACLMVLFLGAFFASQTQAASSRVSAGGRLITVHDDGHDRGLLTHATTLREALKEAKIHIDPNDRVEPGLDDELVANNYEANIYRARPVTIIDGALRKRVMSPYRTAKQITENAGVSLHDEDITAMTADSDIVAGGAGIQLDIDRATSFMFILYGKKIEAYTQAETVADMLKQKGITLASDDTLSIAMTAKINSGMKIELWRNGKQTVTKDKSVAFEVKQIQDADRPVGYKKITTPGIKGKQTIIYEVVMKNGKEVSRKKIRSVLTKKPSKQVEIIGAKPTFSGDFAAALAKLRSCEGGYTTNTGNGYYGAYQYDIGTWGNYKGYPNAAAAPPAVQDERAWLTYKSRGWSPWPSCGASLPDIYR